MLSRLAKKSFNGKIKDFFEIWNNKIYRKYRKDLLLGNRKNKPCSDCNASGTVHGFKHAKDWKKIFS